MPNRLPASFVVIVFLAVFFAMFVPQGLGNWIRSSTQFVFWPARILHSATSNLSDGPVVPGSLTIPANTPAGEQIRLLSEENQRLSGEVVLLQTQLEQVRNQLSEQQRMAQEGKTGLVSARVISVDAGGRDVIRIQSQNTAVGLEVDMPVTYSGGVAGRISTVGMGGQADVQLITDRQAKLMVAFGRFENGKFAMFSTLGSHVIEGMGKDELRLDLLKQDEVKLSGLRLGDWVVLDDSKWPANMKGTRVGQISFIGQRQDATGFAEIRIRPSQSLTKLTQATVVTE
jgi:cell shape-determining protein MreC